MSSEEEDFYDSDEEEVSTKKVTSKKTAKAEEEATKKYVKKTPHEHVLTRPDSYIGSIEMSSAEVWVYDAGIGMNHRKIHYVPGLYKIFDEILVNAADHKQRDPTMNSIKVEIDAENNKISVYNNGNGIPVVMHKTEKVYVPEMIFGQLLTSSNYDDTEKKVTGGRNGYGAKLANIFSTEFSLETVDTAQGKKYIQSWSDNMYKAGKASITKATVKNGYTKITFSPDLKKFGMEKLDKDIVALMTKRVYDIAGCNSSIKVELNKQPIKISNFTAYCKLYLKDQKCIFEKVNDRWEVCLSTTDGQPEQVSFVNSINTIRGGTHVIAIQDVVAKHVIEQCKKKNKKVDVKPHQVKQQLWVFANCLIENPTFDSQTKETLTTKKSAFGSRFDPSADFLKKICGTAFDLVEKVLSYAQFKEKAQLKRAGGKKKERVTGIQKLSDANDAGSKKHAHECTLILTEGDSAKTLAISGLSVVGRDKYGVFPLKGKLLNVREASDSDVRKNEELTNITKILGLVFGKVYDRNSVKTDLRYGKLMIMADQDHDGSHIKGLLINFVHHFWPSLIQCNTFLQEFVTPIIKAFRKKEEVSFFTLPEYESWKKTHPSGWKIKYYKGLGTSTAEEAKEYFKNLKKHRIAFSYTGAENDRLIDMAFSKKKADERKDWIRAITEDTFVDHTKGSLTISDFINKELVLFSAADCVRSIPCIVDGFKPGQRKILFCCFKRRLVKEIKVAQLAGYVSEQSAYHHGEVSLQSTIINMAQNFVGSNNINLLYPGGQFGTRLLGGKDAASPRYIFTRLSKITRAIFPETDDHLLEYLDDDGQSIEPKWYIPIIPMVLVNGSEGIGTGWRSSIPNYSPHDIIDNIKRLLKGEEPEEMHPWYQGFTGSLEIGAKNNYNCLGTYEVINDDTIRVTELPVGMWTQSFKERLEELHVDAKGKTPIITDFRDCSGDTTVDFKIKFEPGVLKNLLDTKSLEKTLKLISTKFNASNMNLFAANGEIKKYDSALDILREFFDLRLSFYHKRKEWLVKVKREDVARISNRVRFILAVISGDIVVSNRKKVDLLQELEDKKYDKLAPKTRKPVAKNAIETEEEIEESKESYDYLLSMPLWNLTLEKVQALKKEKEERETELRELLATTKEAMWEGDINELETVLVEFEKLSQNQVKGRQKVIRKAEVVEKKRATKKPTATAAAKKPVAKKAVKNEDSDADEMEIEEKPKPARGAAAAAKKAATTSAAAKKTADISSFFGGVGVKRAAPAAKAPPAKKAKLEESEDEKPVKKAPAPRRAAAVAAAKKKVESDSDEEEELDLFDDSESETPKKPAPKTKLATIFQKPAPPKKKVTSDDESSSDLIDDSESEVTPQKPAAKKLAPIFTKKPATAAKPEFKKPDTPEPSESSAFDDSESEAPPPKKPAAKVAPVKAAPAKKAAAPIKKAPAKKKPDSDEESDSIMDDSEVSQSEEQIIVPRNLPKRGARRVVVSESEESDDDSDF